MTVSTNNPVNNGALFRGEIFRWSNKESHTKIPVLQLQATRNKHKIRREIAIFLLAYGISTPDQFYEVMKEIDVAFNFRARREMDGIVLKK